MIFSRCNIKCFTLLELLLALSLSSMLMLAILAVIGSFTPLTATAKESAKLSNEDYARVFVSLLREDMVSAIEIGPLSNNSIRLTGFMSLDSEDHRRSGQIVEVKYSLRREAGKIFLIRFQRWLDNLDNQQSMTDLVCCNVDSFELIEKSLPEDKLGHYLLRYKVSGSKKIVENSIFKNMEALQ